MSMWMAPFMKQKLLYIELRQVGGYNNTKIVAGKCGKDLWKIKSKLYIWEHQAF